MAMTLVKSERQNGDQAARFASGATVAFGRQCAMSIALDDAAKAIFAADCARVGVSETEAVWDTVAPIIRDLYRRQAEVALRRVNSAAVNDAKAALRAAHGDRAFEIVEAFEELLLRDATPSVISGATRQ